MKYGFVIKVIFFIVLCFIVSSLTIFMYAPTADLAISQLNGDNIDYAMLQTWQTIKNVLWIIYPILFAVFFTKDIKKIIVKTKGEN